MLETITQPILAFLTSFPPPLASFLLGAVPISEVRGAAIFAFQQGDPSLVLYGIAGNIAAALALIMLWDLLQIEKIGRFITGARLEKRIEDFKKNHELGETIALAIFIGIPLPITGVYTGVLVGKILNISDRKLFVASIAGILMAALIMCLALSGVFSFLSIFT